MLTYNTENQGEFQEHDFGKWFTYRATSNPWALSNGLAYEVDVLDGVRFATIKKTLAHVCTSEGDSGEPILEKWSFKKHHIYN